MPYGKTWPTQYVVFPTYTNCAVTFRIMIRCVLPLIQVEKRLLRVSSYLFSFRIDFYRIINNSIYWNDQFCFLVFIENFRSPE